jgi:hypothetical protein
MSEHLNSHRLELFIAHKLAPDELLRAAKHISVCESCRERISDAERTGVRIENLRTELRRDVKAVGPHLDYQQLAAYVDDMLDAVEREIADNHLTICPSCTREAQELKSLREELMQQNNALNRVANLPSDHLWHRFSDSLRAPRRIAWAATLLITIAAAVLLLWQHGKTPEVLNNNNANTPEVVSNGNGNRNEPEPSNNSSVNVNANVPSSSVAVYAAVIKRALETQKIDRAPVLIELAGRPSTLMGSSEGVTFSLLNPVGTVTLSNRPIFEWQPLAGATSYQVHILDTDFKVVAESGPVTATSWSPPTALDRGGVYLWQVSAVKEGEVIFAPAAPRPEARFKILTGSKTHEVQQAVKAQAGSPLERGIIYAHMGLLDDAEREFHDALSQTQERALARKLLQNLRALRR